MSSWETSFFGSFLRPRPRVSARPAGPPALDTSTFLTRTRLRLPSSPVFAVFLRSTGNSILPTTVGPVNFSAFARTTSGSAGLAGASGAAGCDASAAGSGAAFATASSFFASALAGAFFLGFSASRSTFPTTLTPFSAGLSAASPAGFIGAAAGAAAFGATGASGLGATSAFLGAGGVTGAASAGLVRFTTGAASLLRNWLRSISGSSSSCFTAVRFLALASVMLSRSWMPVALRCAFCLVSLSPWKFDRTSA